MTEENISQEFRLKNINEIRNYFIKEIDQNELMSKKYKNVCRVLDYIEHLLFLVSTFAACVFISASSFLVGISIGITSSAVGLEICVIITGIKKYKWIIKKRKKKYDKIVLLTKAKLNSVLVISCISNNNFF